MRLLTTRVPLMLLAIALIPIGFGIGQRLGNTQRVQAGFYNFGHSGSWYLTIAEGNSTDGCRLRYFDEAPEGVDCQTPTGFDLPWHVTVSRPFEAVNRGDRVQITCWLRAVGGRKIELVMDNPDRPQNALAHLYDIAVTDEWSRHTFAFECPEDAAQTRIVWNLGGDPRPLHFQWGAFSVERITASPAAQ